MGTAETMNIFEGSGAAFSGNREYRYRLWRTWDSATLPALFILLNPSTADETKNDPTVERCERRARTMGFGGLVVANLFALRSTDPKALYSHPDPVGEINDLAILSAAVNAGIIICGWGRHGGLPVARRSCTRPAGEPQHIYALSGRQQRRLTSASALCRI